MPRPSLTLRPLAAVGLGAALLGYVGCNPSGGPASSSANAPAVVQPAPKSDSTAEPAAKSIANGLGVNFTGWPNPKAALVISGEQLGYLEPCGCTKGQLGGLLRRYSVVEQLRNQNKWPIALVDLGGLIKDPASARGGPEETKLKLTAALKALATMKYDAVALSADDLKVGVDEAIGQFLNLPGETLKIVAANVTAPGLEAKVVPSVKATAGPVRFGITAVVDPATLKALRDPSLDLLSVKSIDATLPAVLVDLEKDTQTQVLLVQGPPELAKELAKKHPGFDVVVATSAFPDPPADAERLNGGRTLLVNVGQKGKYVGVVGVFDDPKQPYRYQRVSLSPRYDGPATAMKAVIQDEFRETLKAQRVTESYPKHGYVNGAQGATFVGAEACKTCHPNTFAKWSATRHSHAFESLLSDPKPNVAYDAECVSCHTTGFEYTSGWKSPELTAFLKGNQCENCHGPASRHTKAPDDKTFRAALHLSAELADKNGLCIRCHDEDNSPKGFDFPQRWGQIIHKALDTYTDPKVHQGQPAKK